MTIPFLLQSSVLVSFFLFPKYVAPLTLLHFERRLKIQPESNSMVQCTGFQMEFRGASSLQTQGFGKEGALGFTLLMSSSAIIYLVYLHLSIDLFGLFAFQ